MAGEPCQEQKPTGALHFKPAPHPQAFQYLIRVNSKKVSKSGESVKQGVKSGIVVSFVSVHSVSYELVTKSLASVPIKGLRLLRPLYTVTRKNRRICPVCLSFKTFLVNEIKRLQKT